MKGWALFWTGYWYEKFRRIRRLVKPQQSIVQSPKSKSQLCIEKAIAHAYGVYYETAWVVQHSSPFPSGSGGMCDRAWVMHAALEHLQNINADDATVALTAKVIDKVFDSRSGVYKFSDCVSGDDELVQTPFVTGETVVPPGYGVSTPYLRCDDVLKAVGQHLI